MYANSDSEIELTTTLRNQITELELLSSSAQLLAGT